MRRISVLSLFAALFIAATLLARPTVAQSTIEGVPTCTDHDNKQWHSLVKKSGSTITCTYGHEHHDDPATAAAVSVFGQPGSSWGSSDSISYPWATSGENATLGKHAAYKYQVVTGMSCQSSRSDSRLSITDLRIQAHSDSSPGAATRFHSAYVEAKLCDMDNPSWSVLVRGGGHIDYGCLRVKNAAGGFDQVAVPQDSMPPTLVCTAGGPRREHGSTTATQGQKFESTWYGRLGVIGTLAVLTDTWGPINPSNPSEVLFFPSQAAPPFVYNNSSQVPGHLLELAFSNAWDLRDGVDDGLVSLNGFTNLQGGYLASCGPVGPSCVPLQAMGAKQGIYQVRSNLSQRQYDVNSPVTGKSLIAYPN